MSRRPVFLSVYFTLMLSLFHSAPVTAADSSQAPPAPTNLSVTAPKSARAIPQGGWSNSPQLELRFQVQSTGTALTPQVELQPAGTPFSGQANFNGPSLTGGGLATVTVNGLQNSQKYHWQARVSDSNGISSPWTTASDSSGSTADFGIDTMSPTRPVLRSDTNPDQNAWYHTGVVQVAWNSTDSASGVQGYTYVLERQAHVIPPGPVSTSRGLRLSNLADGVWIVAVRSVDRAGNWSPTATYRVQLDRQAPQLTWLSANRIPFNPLKGPLTVRFRVSKNANVHLDLWKVGGNHPLATFTFARMQAGQVASIIWNGKTRNGTPLARGYYYFAANAVDRAFNQIHRNLGGIELNPVQPHKAAPTGELLFPGDGKRIIVQLSREMLYAYDGDRLFLQTFVTTGNPSLPTPIGTYSVMAKYHPYQFVSPWPLGSPYYYPPSWSQFAMLFRDGGYFLHDAPWRGAFGPGTNGAGQPGTNYGGTHGCVNIPPNPMLALWNWTPIGTKVEVVP